MRRGPALYLNGHARSIEPQPSNLLRKSSGRNVGDVVKPNLQGRRVLVTGAGGSIGSELVKQLSMLSPAHLVLIDACEFNLYQISHAIEQLKVAFSWAAHICDVRDLTAMRHIFMRERPDIVFHAAALKHVPLLEKHNVIEAVRTNVLGTKIVLDLCAAMGIAFVQISTDKAVNPSSQMGMTKRVAEILVHESALHHPDIRMSLVRFGNVLGSSGSVVPLFRRQIAAGGPVTVTHPEMTRFMMSIEEAVGLTLAASCLPQTGYSLYVLEMGEPVRILDLAVELIQMAGYRPFVDVDIQFVGMRPGEKLHEELSYPWEALQPTTVPGIRVAIPSFDPRPSLRHIDELLAAADARDCDWVRRALVRVVPEYIAVEEQLEAQPETKLAATVRNGHELSRKLKGKIIATAQIVRSRAEIIGADETSLILSPAQISRSRILAPSSSPGKK